MAAPDVQLKRLRDEMMAVAKKFKALSALPGMGMVAREAHDVLFDQVLEIDGWMGWDE